MSAEGIRDDSLPSSLVAAVENHTPCGSEDAHAELQRLQSVCMFVRSLWDVLCDADPVFTHCPPSDLFGFFDVLLQAPGPAEFVQWCKYLTCWPMAKFLRQEMPVCPVGIEEAMGGSHLHFPLRGGARRHFRNLLASRSSEVRPNRVMWAILQGVKRGCAEVPESFIELTMRKHQAALTQVLPSLTDTEREAFRLKFREIWRTKREVKGASGTRYHAWGETTQMSKDCASSPNPGFHACSEYVRRAHGRCGMVRDRWILELVEKGILSNYRRPSQDVCPEPRLERELWSMVEVRPGEAVEVYVDWHHLPPIPREARIRWGLESLALRGGQCTAVVAGILEPLKCRLITKGPGLAYFAAQPLQRALWQRLQKFPCFALTGCPLDTSHLAGVEQGTKTLDLPFDKWVSGDYSAATDGLSQEINSLCLEEAILASNLGESEAKIARAVLGNHRIQYPGTTPDKKGTVRYNLPSEIQQTNGQLMGSVLSFPILCAINVAAYWLALEEHTGRKFALGELPVLVNGDDICFKADDQFYGCWQRWIRSAGFTLSAGKNYISPDFVTLNSEGFVCRPKGRSVPFVPVNFLNTGLLYAGRSVERRIEFDGTDNPPKVGIRSENREMPFTAKVNRVISESNNPRRTLLRVHELYRADILHHTHRGEINMHAAPELGGLGIVLPEGCTTRFTPWQQRVAGYLRHKWKSGEFGTRLPDRDGQKVWDLNAPMGLGGRFTYQCRRKPNLKLVSDVRPGVVVVRKRWEPCRENERELVPPAADLMNYQAEPDESVGQWKIAQLSASDRVLCRSYSGSRVISPLAWDDVLREQVSETFPEAKQPSVLHYLCPENSTIYSHAPHWGR
nr:MAG: putative RNA-dependent RNA polymerase [Narnaviridae sp.]